MTYEGKRSFDVTPKASGPTKFLAYEKRKKLQAPKIKRWNHQDDLAALIGKTLMLSCTDRDNAITGVLVESDQWTIKLLINEKQETFYKHVVGSYIAI